MGIKIICPYRKTIAEWEKYLVNNKEIGKSYVTVPPLNFPQLNLKNVYKIYGLKFNSNDVNYFTDSGLSYMLAFKKISKSAIWCWDICALFLKYFSTKSKLFSKFNCRYMKKANMIVSASNNTKRDLINYLKFPEEKIRTIYVGIDHEIFKPIKNKEFDREFLIEKYNLSSDEKILLYVGGEQPRKNLLTLIKSIHSLKKTIPCKLLIVGPRDWGENYHKKLIEMVKLYDLEKNIIFVGNFPYEKVPFFYNTADVFVFPTYYEGFGLPLLEALACGCPVVTTNCSSVPEVVGDAAIKINDPFDHHLLAEKIKEVLVNDGLRQDMIRKGLKQAKKFSWEKYAKGVYQVCEEVWNEP